METESFGIINEELSDMNASLTTIYRLGNIKIQLLNANINNDVLLRVLLLKSFYLEIYPIISKEERQVQIKKFSEMQNLYFRLINNRENTRKRKIRFGISIEDVRIIDDWEQELRLLEQNHGLNVKIIKDARYLMNSD